MSIKANSVVDDTHMNVSSGINLFSQTANNNKASAAISVMVTNVTNNSEVTVEGADTKPSSGTEQTYGMIVGKKLTVEAQTDADYKRVKHMVSEALDAVAKLKEELNKMGESTAVADLKGKLATLSDKFTALNNDIPETVTDGSGNTVNGNLARITELDKRFLSLKDSLTSAVDSMKQIKTEVTDTYKTAKKVIEKFKQFTDVENYANYYAKSGIEAGEEGKQPTVSAAASVAVVAQNANSNVIIGKNALITAENDIAIDSKSTSDLVSITGQKSKTENGKSGIGVSVSVNNIGASSTTLVNEGASITSNTGNIEVKGNTDLMNTSIVASSGAAGDVAVNGMAGVSVGNSTTLALVDDEALLKTLGNNKKVNIDAKNKTFVINVVGGLSQSNSVSVGAGVAINLNDVNTIAGVTNTDYAEATTYATTDVDSITDESEKVKAKAENKKKEAIRLANEKINDSTKSLFGTQATTINDADRGIYTTVYNVHSSNEGMINAVGVAGSIATNKEGTDSSQQGFFSKMKDKADALKHKVVDPINNLLNKFDDLLASKVADKTGYKMKDAVNAAPPGEEAKTEADKKDITTKDESGGTTTPEVPGGGGGGGGKGGDSESTANKAKVTVAGSVAINIINGDTSSLTDGAVFHLQNGDASNKQTFNSEAVDNAFIGAWAGAAAVNWSSSSDSSSSSVGVSGAVGVNVINRGANSIINDSTVYDAEIANNGALAGNAAVAAALGLSVSKSSGQGSNTTVSAAVNYNAIDNDLLAVMKGATFLRSPVDASAGATPRTLDALSINNTTFNNALQISGGVSGSVAIGGSSQTAGGATVVISDINNTMASSVFDSHLNNVKDVTVESLVGVKQIGAAIGFSVTAGSESGNALNGAFAYNSLNNQVLSSIEGTSIEKDATATDSAVYVQSYDFNTAKDSASEKDKQKYKTNQYSGYVKKAGLDSDGSSYKDNIKNTNEEAKNQDDSEDKDYTGMISTADSKGAKEGGSLIVTAAVSVAGGQGNAVGAGLSISDIKNNFVSKITDSSTINTKKVNVQSDIDTQLIGVAAGIAGSGKFAGAGSVTWDMIENKTESYIADSTIDAGTDGDVDVIATNNALSVNVAGQVSVGTNGGGLALAYHGMDNKTLAHLDRNTITTNTLDNKATSGSKIVTVGAGVSAALSGTALNGTVAVNRGSNNTQAYITDTDKTHLIKATTAEVEAKDSTTVTAIAGGVSAGSGGAIGGAITINDIGGFSGQGDKADQKVLAKIEKAKLDVGALKVSSEDKAHMVTVGAGLAASGGLSFQGVGAASLINKSVESNIINSDINTGGDYKGKVELKATNEGKITGTAAVVSVGSTAGVGVGIGVNRIVQNTNTSVSGTNAKVNDLLMNSKSDAEILAIGVGAAASGGVSVAGSFGTNIINNNTVSAIKTSTIDAKGSVGVVSRADDRLSNYAGVIAGGATGAGGLSVSVNTITGDTKATVEDSDVTAKDQTGTLVETKSGMNDDKIIHEHLAKDAFDIDSLVDGRQVNSQSGLVVDSSATHSISSAMATGGGSGTVAIFGTVNVNNIGGSTLAKIIKSNVNQNGGGKVRVNAQDFVNSSGLVVSLAVAGSGAVGLLNDTNLYNRTTEAGIYGRKVGETTGEKTLKGSDIDVTASSKAGFMNFDASVSAAVAGAAFSGTSVVNKITGVTGAHVDYMTGTLKNHLNVNAYHKDAAFVSGVSGGVAGLGAGAGLATAVLTQSSTVKSSMIGSNMQEETDKSSSSISVNAKNDNVVSSLITSTGIAGFGAGIAGTVAVNNYNQDVETTVDGSTLKAGKVTITAKEEVLSETDGGQLAGGLGGVGVSTTVNTFNDNVNVKLSNGAKVTASAGDLMIGSEAVRDINQTAMNTSAGAVAVDANILVTTVNRKVDNEDAKKKIDEANATRSESNQKPIGYKGLSGAEKDEMARNTQIGASYGTDSSQDTEKGIITSINGSTLVASNKVDIKSEEKNAANMKGGSFAAGAVSTNGAIGVLVVGHNTKTSTENSKITGNNISVQSLVGDNSNQGVQINMYQGAGGVVAVGAAVAEVRTSGSALVQTNDTTMKAPSAVIINAQDTSTTFANAYGLTAGVVAGGAIVSQAQNESNVTVDASNLTINEKAPVTLPDGTVSDPYGTVDIKATKANTVKAKALSGGFGLDSANASVVIANDSGNAKIALHSGKIRATILGINSVNSPYINADGGAISGALTAALGASVTTATASGTSEVEIAKDGTGLTLEAKTINVDAEVKQQSGRNNNIDAKLVGIGVSGSASIKINVVTAKNVLKSNIDIGDKVTFAGTPTLALGAINNSRADSNVYGLTVSAGVASGSNFALVNNQTSSKITIANNGKENAVSALLINAQANGKNTVTADGDGGGLVAISPIAALTSSAMNNTAEVNLNGKWNVTDIVDVIATKSLATDVHTDTLSAAVASASGAWAVNGSNGTSTINVNATITSGGGQSYVANTALDIQNHLKASGYGALALSGAATFNNGSGINPFSKGKSQGNIDLTGEKGINVSDKVTFSNSILKTTGRYSSIVAQSQVSGTVNMTNAIYAAGAAAGTIGYVDSKVSYNSQVESKKSTFTTLGAYSDVTLAAADNTKVTVDGMADTQGGALGVSSSNVKSNLLRTNTITVDADSRIYSSNDVNLFAGMKSNSGYSTLEHNIYAQAYNRTLIPLDTDPDLKNMLEESNQVHMAGNAEAVKHGKIYADAGNVATNQIAKSYIIYNGSTERGTAELTSTAAGTRAKSDQTNDYADITGNITAGIHNILRIKTSGGNLSGSTVIKNPYVQFELVGEESQWFAQTDWYKENVKNGRLALITDSIANSLGDRYKEAFNKLSNYAKGSENYNIQLDQLNYYARLLQSYGYGVDKSGNVMNTGGYEPFIKVPEAVVSGGNISITAPHVVGTGFLYAKGSPQLTLTNTSLAGLKVDNLNIADDGGFVMWNGKDQESNQPFDRFTGRIKKEGQRTATSPASVIGLYNSPISKPRQWSSDIWITSGVVNNAGNVEIINSNNGANILITGGSNAPGISGIDLHIQAYNGAVAMNSPEGLVDIGYNTQQRYYNAAVLDRIRRILTENTIGGNRHVNLKPMTWAEYKKFLTDTSAENAANNPFFMPNFNWQKLALEYTSRFTSDELAYLTWTIKDVNENSTPDLKRKNGMLAAGDIYINAAIVNINGLIQSGYNSFTNTLTSDQLSKVTSLESSYGRLYITDDAVVGNNTYKISGGEAYYDSVAGEFKYQVGIYYNPYTKHLVTENIAPKGGHVYINGGIVSSGAGRIVAAGGTPTISLDTSTIDRDLVVSEIKNKNISGLIEIKDRFTNTETKITSGSGNYRITGNKYLFNTGGLTSTVRRHYKRVGDALFWGGWTLEEGDLERWAVQENLQKTETSDNSLQPSADAVATGKSWYTTDKDIFISIDTYDTGGEVAGKSHSDVVYDHWYEEMVGYGHPTTTWTTTQGQGTDILIGINVSKPVAYRISNNQDDKISINSKGNLLIDGNLQSAKEQGQVILTSTAGSVKMNTGSTALVKTDHLTVQANTGIDLNQASYSTEGAVNLITKKGNINLKSNYGNLIIQNAYIGRDTNEEITVSMGDVNIHAYGDVINGAPGDRYVVKGKRIDITSDYGSIGTSEAPIYIWVGGQVFGADARMSSLNAKALKNIYIAQKMKGDVRLGQVISETGDVVLEARQGSFVDALGDANNDNASAEKQIESWYASGVISDDDGDDTSTHAGEEAKSIRLNGLVVKLKGLVADSMTDKAVKDGKAMSEDQAWETAYQNYQNAVAARDEAKANKLKADVNLANSVALAEEKRLSVSETEEAIFNQKVSDYVTTEISNYKNSTAYTDLPEDKRPTDDAIKTIIRGKQEYAAKVATLTTEKETNISTQVAAYRQELNDAASEANANLVDKENALAAESDRYINKQKEILGTGYTVKEVKAINALAEATYEGKLPKEQAEPGERKLAKLETEQESLLSAIRAAVTDEASNRVVNYADETLLEAMNNTASNAELEAARQAYLQVMQDKNATETQKETARTDYLNKQKTILNITQDAVFDDLMSKSEMGDWLIEYREVNNTGAKYGWSKNQLLFAIQNSILNSAPGTTKEVLVPNVQGNSITLKANKGVGIDEKATSIKYQDLTNIENLKLLATATSGDVTWNDSKQELTLARQKAINIQLNNGPSGKPTGSITVSGSENIYLAAEKNTPLNINTISTPKNVTLVGQLGVHPLGDGTIPDIKGANLILKGGSGALGTSDRPLLVDMTGTVDVNTGGSIYLKSTADRNLTVMAAGAGSDLYLVSKKGFTMASGDGNNLGYLQSTNGMITLVAQDGDVGESSAGAGIRIVSGATVRAYGENVYLTDQKTAIGNGETHSMNVGMLHATNETSGITRVENDNNVNVVTLSEAARTIRLYKTLDEATDETYTQDESINAPKAEIISNNGRILIDGLVKTTKESTKEAPALHMKAKTEINESGVNGGIDSDVVKAESLGPISITNAEKNFIGTALFGGYDDKELTGNVEMTVNVPVFKAMSLSRILGNVRLKNIHASGNLMIESAMEAVANPQSLEPDKDGTITYITNQDIIVNHDVSAENQVDLQTTNGNVTVNGNIDSEKKYVNIHTEQGNIEVNGNKESNTQGNITAGTDVTISTKTGTVTISGSVEAKDGKVLIKSDNADGDKSHGAVTINGSVKANQTASEEDGAGIVKIVTQDGNIHLKGDVDGANGVSASSEISGDITIDGTVTSQNGGLNANTNNGAITFNGSRVETNGSIEAETKSGQITTKDGTTLNASEGNVKLKTETGAIQVGGNVSGQNVSAETKTGDILFKGTTESTVGDVKAKTENGAITYDMDVTAKDEVIATTNTGNITFKGNTKSTDGDVEASTKTGDITFKGTTTSVNNHVEASTLDGNINFVKTVSGKEGVSAITTKGNIEVGSNANVESSDGAVEFTTGKEDMTPPELERKGDITLGGSVNGKTGVSATTKEGDISFQGTTKSEAGSISATTQTGDVGFGGEVHAKNDVTSTVGTGNIGYTGNVTADTGNVSSTTTNTEEGKGNITFGKNSNVEATSGNITSNTNVGDVIFGGKATAGMSINTDTRTGDIQYGGNAQAGNNIASTVATEGNIEFVGDATTTSGSITSKTTSGNIKFNHLANSGKNIESETVDQGDIEYNGEVEAKNDIVSKTGTTEDGTGTGDISYKGTTTADNINSNTNDGDITFSGKADAKNDINSSTTKEGNIQYGGEAKAGHDINSETKEKGNIGFTGKANAGNDINSTTKDGNINFGNDAHAGNNIDSKTRENGNIGFAGSVTADKDILAHTMTEKTGNVTPLPDGNGDIVFEGKVEAKNDVKANAQGNGSVKVQDDVTAMHDIEMTVQNGGENGGIIFDKTGGGNVEVKAETGSVNMTINGSGNISDSHKEVGGTSVKISAGDNDQAKDNANMNNNVIIINKGNGEGIVNVDTIFAQDKAAVSSETKEEGQGGVFLADINGETVAIVVRTDREGAMEVEKMTAGTGVAVQGATVDINELTQRPARDNMLGMSTSGSDPDKPIKRFEMPKIVVNQGILFDQLWVENAYVKVDTGKFYLDKVYVEEKATFSNGNMVSNIFGVPPALEKGQMSTYWNNTSIHKPKDDLDAWKGRGTQDKWQFLYFSNGGNVQESNGNLLSLNPYYYVYDQRYTMDDVMRRMSSDTIQNFYPKYYNTNLHYYERFTTAEIKEAPVKVINANEEELEVIK